MGEGLTVDGVPLELGYFSADAKPIDVARFYADAWRARKFSVTYTIRDDHAEVGAYDVAGQRMRSVSVVRTGGRVTVFCSSMPMAGGQIARPSGRIAVPAQALFVRRSSSREGGRTRESASYVVMGELEPARDALIGAMKRDGWKVGRVRASQKRSGVTLRFERGGEHAMSTLIEDANTGAVGVQTFETLGGDDL